MIKRFEDYTDIEVYAMTDEDLDRALKIELMENGVKIPVEPTLPTYKQVALPDLTVYSVTNVSGHFYKIEDAQAVADLLNEYLPRMTGSDYDYSLSGRDGMHEREYFRSYDDGSFKVTNEKMYSRKLYKEIVGDLSTNKKLKEAYDEELKVYREEMDATTEIKETIYNRHADVCDRFSKLESLKERYESYLKLADNDKKQAMKFFKAAYAIGSDEEYYVVHGNLPEPVKAAQAVERSA